MIDMLLKLIVDNLAAVARSQGAPNREIDSVADESNASVHHHRVDASGMIAARRENTRV